MKQLRFYNTLKPYEWMSLAAGLLIAIGVYAVLIHPSMIAITDRPRYQAQAQAATNELDRMRSKLQRVQKEIKEKQSRLTAIGGGLPPAGQKDLQIARLTAMADQCQVQIDQYQPLGTVAHEDHFAHMVQFTGQGGFVEIHQLLALIESEVDFVDITNFSITADQAGNASTCRLIWICRINDLRSDKTAPAQVADNATRRNTPVEGSAL